MTGGATTPVARGGARTDSATWSRLVRGVAVAVLPVLTGLYVGATAFAGGTLVPWRPVMVDLAVYRQAGAALLAGQDVYALPGQLPFLYPPFAALLAVPLALLPASLVEVGWTAAGALAVLAMLHRFGLSGWPLSLVATAVVVVVEPVSQTLAFGQLGIFLVALVVLDLVPGPRAFGGRRRIPEGVLTALAAAIKLTPAIFVIYLLVVRRWRAAGLALVTGAIVTLGTAAVIPGPSLTFWGRLARGDTGLGGSVIYYTNQSVMADVVRVLGLGPGPAALGLALSALVALLGVWAGASWHRRGEVGLAVVVVGVAGLFASPVSWLHHFVWVVPLGLCLLERTRQATAVGAVAMLPAWFQTWGWVLVGWVIVSPFRRLPNGADVELTWAWWQHGLASVTAVLGVGWLVAALLVARRPGPVRRIRDV